jgi:hypothetical protein
MLQFPLAIMITIVAFYALELYTAFGRLEKPTYNFTNAEIDSFSTILKGGKVIIIVGSRGIEDVGRGLDVACIHDGIVTQVLTTSSFLIFL